MPATSEPMNFTTIIPTYDRDEDLERCLRSLQENSVYANEVIVLYDLNDNTKAICDKYGAKSVFDHARANGKRVKSLGGILNEGLKAATNDYVLYLNDDCLVLPRWDEIAAGYFAQRDDLGLLVLKTYGIDNQPWFRIAMMGGRFAGIPCANYGIINKKAGHRFDERIQWYSGDADIALQFAADGDYAIDYTSEDMIIHNHRIDAARTFHDSDYFTNFFDEMYFRRKWVNFRVIGGAGAKLAYSPKHSPILQHLEYIYKFVYKFAHTALRYATRKIKLCFSGTFGK